MLSRFRLVLFCLVVSVRYEQDMCKMYAWCKVICKPRHVRKGEASLKAISTDRSNPSLEGQLGATHDRRLLLRDEMSVADLGGGRIEQPCTSKNRLIFIYLFPYQYCITHIWLVAGQNLAMSDPCPPQTGFSAAGWRGRKRENQRNELKGNEILKKLY